MLTTTSRMSLQTQEYVDQIQPQLLHVSPWDNANGVVVDTSIELIFSEPILEASITAENFSLLDANGQPVSGSFQTIESNVILIPDSPLEHFRNYHIRIGSRITELSGNPMANSSESSFWTLGKVVITAADEQGMIVISGGTFQMVADSQIDSNALANEEPLHNVILTAPFYISGHEVTVGEYKACVDAGGWTEPGSGTYFDNLSLPVNKVSWLQALAFAHWKTEQSSKSFRLCTETE